jgi:hypothetical protein
MGISASVKVNHDEKLAKEAKPVDETHTETINFCISVSVPSDIAKDLENSSSGLGLYSQSNTSFKCGNNQVTKKINRKNTTLTCTIIDNSISTEYTDKEECQKVFKQLVKQYCELDI